MSTWLAAVTSSNVAALGALWCMRCGVCALAREPQEYMCAPVWAFLLVVLALRSLRIFEYIYVYIYMYIYTRIYVYLYISFHPCMHIFVYLHCIFACMTTRHIRSGVKWPGCWRRWLHWLSLCLQCIHLNVAVSVDMLVSCPVFSPPIHLGVSVFVSYVA